jgi:hypothetical protein
MSSFPNFTTQFTLCIEAHPLINFLTIIYKSFPFKICINKCDIHTLHASLSSLIHGTKKKRESVIS